MPGVPGAPGAEPRRHWLSLPSAFPAGGRGGGRLPALPLWCPRGGRGACPRAALAVPAPGERTISNAEVPLPRSPLSLAAGTAHRKVSLSVLRRTGDAEGKPLSNAGLAGRASVAGASPPAGHLLGKFCKCRRRLNAGDARGEAPCIRKQKNLPLPTGKGGGGMGAKKQTKGRVGGRQRRQAPRRVPLTPAEAATPGTSPPLGTTAAKTISAANGLMQGCRGRSPRRNKVIFSPFPPGRGAGGWGQKSKPKAG